MDIFNTLPVNENVCADIAEDLIIFHEPEPIEVKSMIVVGVATSAMVINPGLRTIDLTTYVLLSTKPPGAVAPGSANNTIRSPTVKACNSAAANAMEFRTALKLTTFKNRDCGRIIAEPSNSLVNVKLFVEPSTSFTKYLLPDSRPGIGKAELSVYVKAVFVAMVPIKELSANMFNTRSNGSPRITGSGFVLKLNDVGLDETVAGGVMGTRGPKVTDDALKVVDGST